MKTPLEILLERRSIRSFEARPVEADVIARLKEATLRAPTAGNMVLWSVIDVQDPERKKALSVLCDNQPFIAKAPLIWVFLADTQKWIDGFESGDSRGKSPDTPWRAPGWGDLHLCMQDAIIAAQTAVIAAESLGLASCYVGDIIENYEKVASLLSLPRYAAPAAMLVFGYPPEAALHRPLTPRPPQEALFMIDAYRHMDAHDLENAFSVHTEQLRERGVLPYGNTGSYADLYYIKKYSSGFMREMNRSAKAFFERWGDGMETSESQEG
ncbi:nitroreductase family protein [Parasphaerochaeta coccoides]|uniref:Nitroreductase n=1 Tax=Parasphaerochaeta coccoides (strain ATCC BAA-1237 / DSM 17374 / SPN1) TaxID=760011 RepID=F4GLW0_PARC1|nr:nitroreductase family protein [Parasphaerochaeta coccoides]AEC03001.1 nitroreductase [Parasphaerochaeta coccoides DSM 17374]